MKARPIEEKDAHEYFQFVKWYPISFTKTTDSKWILLKPR